MAGAGRDRLRVFAGIVPAGGGIDCASLFNDRPEIHLRPSVFLASSGGLATAVAFGPARIGYGLFLPRFREAFSLTDAGAGLIASAAFAGFFVALVLTGWMVARRGPRLPVVLGSLAALLGLGVVALAQNAAMLAVGVVLAATSAGFCWSPFNNAAERAVPERLRGRTLSVISTGTTAGIACAGGLALAVAGLSQGWRVVWLGFALAALLSAMTSAWALRQLPDATHAAGRSLALRRLVDPAAVPLYAIACSFGITNSIYLSFAVDQVSRAGGLPGMAAESAGPMLYIAFGAGGMIGLATAEIEQRIGLTALVRGIFLCSFVSLALIGWAPTSWPAVLVSAALQGACVMILSAIYSFWSERLYPGLPTLSFTAVLTVFAAGNIVGPAAAGAVAGATDLGATLLVVALISLATAVCFPGRRKRAALTDRVIE